MEVLAQESPFMSVIDFSRTKLERLYHTHRRIKDTLSEHHTLFSMLDE
jgi:hypothetical protein